MKRFLPLLALLAAPHFALAQPHALQPLCKKKPPLPNAQYLLDHLYAPYEAARTFRGTFDILIKSDDPKNLVSEIHSQTLFRFDARGDLTGQNSTTGYVSRADINQRQTMQSVDDGRAAKVIFEEQKVWSSASERDKSPFLSTLLKPLLEGVVQVLNKTPNFVPIVSRSVDAGRPVFVLTARNTNILRVVVDAQTRALRSFDLTGNVSIRGSNQSFDEPIGDEELAWTPPADFKRVAEGEVALPAFLGATFQGRPIKTAPTPPQN